MPLEILTLPHRLCAPRTLGQLDRRQVYGRERRPVWYSWGTFLRNHAPHIAAMDLFVVPTIVFSLLYVLVIVRLARRELV
jgi:N6-adenosine-specific RNA methylase IME4